MPSVEPQPTTLTGIDTGPEQGADGGCRRAPQVTDDPRRDRARRYCGDMAAVSTIGGIILIVVALNDVFHTLLRPSATGRLTTLVFRGTWSIARRRAARIHINGPLTVVAAIAVWIVLLAVGWALIYLPHIPEGFSYSAGVDPASYHEFVEALTFSLVALTTLGLGDVVPVDPVIRALAPLEALTGFALLSAAVSWFMQLHPALTRRRALAIELTALSEAGITRMPHSISTARAVAIVESTSRSLAAVTADLVQNAEIFYFTEKDERLSSSRAMAYALQLRDAAIAAPSADLRSAGAVLARILDELARVVVSRYAHVTGESTDDILRAAAGSHGHAWS